MGSHHTKDKGDLGVAKAFADLVGKGYMVLFPATEHAPFDLVGYRDESFLRIQVKFRSLRDGAVSVQFMSAWADRHGTHMKAIDKAAIDLICIYCPETDECYYVLPSAFEKRVTLRVTPCLNGQKVGVLYASDFREMPF